ncbi:unnamed protein product, partial [Brachionus calyciflorus]
MEEFSNFHSYISRIFNSFRVYGTVKIVPPKEWIRPVFQIEKIKDNLMFKHQIIKYLTENCFGLEFTGKEKSLNFDDVKNLLKNDEAKFDFWDKMKQKNKLESLYSIDNDFSFFSDEQGAWNLSSLKTELDLVRNNSGHKVIGIHTPYVYFGRPYSGFAM